MDKPKYTSCFYVRLLHLGEKRSRKRDLVALQKKVIIGGARNRMLKSVILMTDGNRYRNLGLQVFEML